jgi:hypothetical protein
LLWTLEQELGLGWTPEVKAAWSGAYALLADVMRAADDPAIFEAKWAADQIGRQAQMTQLQYYPQTQVRHGADGDRTLRVDHLSPQTRIASIIVTAHAAPKIIANNTSPCDNARPQPKAASTASTTLGSEGPSTAVSSRTYFGKRPALPVGAMSRGLSPSIAEP